MAERRSPARIFAIAAALFISVGLHGLLFLAVWFTPSRAKPLASNNPTLQLVSHSSSIRPISPRLPQRPEPEPTFTVSTLAPAPTYPIEHNKDPKLSVGSVSKGPPATAGNVGAAQVDGGSGAGNSNQTPSGSELGTGKKWFPDAEQAQTVVYAIDRSLSMGTDGAFRSARDAVLDSLHHLPVGSRFQIVPYNRKAEPLMILGHTNLVEVGEDTIQEATRVMDQLEAFGNTDHLAALTRALVLKPDILYLVTDGGDLSASLVEALTKKNQALTGGRTKIHTVEVNHWQGPTAGRPLRVLALRNGGSYQLLAPGREGSRLHYRA